MEKWVLSIDVGKLIINRTRLNTDAVEVPSPIYDVDGNFLGTDDEGLQGEAIVMNISDFVQGMSHEDALALSADSTSKCKINKNDRRKISLEKKN